MPRPSANLVVAKQAFGVVFLALAITMVSRLVPSEVSLVLWGERDQGRPMPRPSANRAAAPRTTSPVWAT
jgi:hypothetical protein